MQPQLAWEGWGLGSSPRHKRSHRAGELWVSLSPAAFPRALNLHSYWGNGLGLPCLDPKQSGVSPQVQANSQGAQPLPGHCTEPITTCQEPGQPQGCPG